MESAAFLHVASLRAPEAHRRYRACWRHPDTLLHSLARFVAGALLPLPAGDEATLLGLRGRLRAARLCRSANRRCLLETRWRRLPAGVAGAGGHRLLLRLLLGPHVADPSHRS